MATVDAITEGTAHGSLTADTPEVITFGPGGKVAVQNRGTTVMYGKLGVSDLTLAAQGTESISPSETVEFYAASDGSNGSICLKSVGTPAYSVSRFTLPREAGGSGGGGGVAGEVELGAASLAALESVSVSDGSGPLSVDGTVELGATTLSALETITVVDGGATLSVDDGAGSLTVDGTVEIGATSLAALETITVVDGGATISVDDGAGSLTVDGTVDTTQAGTWTVQPGNTANTTAWKVDGSAVTQPVSAGSLPLPSGAATAAKQPALGTAGSASTDVITVQGIASGTAQPVSGTVTADTELPAAAALSDTAGNPTTPTVGAASLYWDGSQWVRWQRNVKELTVSSATLANVASSASSVAIFASNAAARGRAVHNDSASATLYLKYGATASATSYTVAILPGQHYEFPAPLYTGACDGIWTAAVGAARTTETS